MENRDRLLPLFDDRDSILGGPTIRSELFQDSPSIFSVTLEEAQMFVKHGADPWAVDYQGRTIVSRGVFQWTHESAQYMLNLPTFDPLFIDRNGHSWLDSALALESVPVSLIRGLAQKDHLLITKHTSKLILDALEGSRKLFFELQSILPLLDPADLTEIVRFLSPAKQLHNFAHITTLFFFSYQP